MPTCGSRCVYAIVKRQVWALKPITSGFTGLMKVHGQLLNRHAGGIEGET
jgi:hypothetical protein